MDLSALELFLAICSVAFGAFVQGSVGFGLAIVAAPFLFQINPMLVPGPLIVMGMAMGLMTTRRYFKQVDLGSLRFAIVGRIPGSLLGAWLLTVATSQQMSFMLGIVVLLAVAGSVSSYKVKATSGNMVVAGFFSGVFGTAASIGGPPMALLMQNEAADRIRANLAAFFVVGSFMSLVILTLSGSFNRELLGYGLALLPGVWFGFTLANRLSARIPAEMVRRGLLLLCSLSGTLAILSAIQK